MGLSFGSCHRVGGPQIMTTPVTGRKLELSFSKFEAAGQDGGVSRVCEDLWGLSHVSV